jgi:hypothetical protein
MQKVLRFLSFLLLSFAFSGIIAAQVTVSISPSSATPVTNATQLFTATVTGSTNTLVTWQVNSVTGGTAATGTIATTGLFLAPPGVPSPATITVKAISQADPSKSASASVTIQTASRSGVSFYVSPSGNDGGPGTLVSPWRTIQHAANMARPGDTINVRAGIYHEHVNIPASGSASAGLITFRNYLSETPVVDGTGLTIPGGQYGLFNLDNQSYVLIQGFEIRNYKSTKQNLVPVGIYITGAGSNLQLLNNHVHAITVTASGCNANALGIAIYGNTAPAPLNNITVSGNQLDHLKTGCSESLAVDGNVDTFAFVNNQIHDNNNIAIDIAGYFGIAPDPNFDHSRNGWVRGNTIYNISSTGNPSYPANCFCSDGIYVDGGTQVLVERNLIHNADIGIEMASENFGRTTSYVTARDNLIYFGNSAGISIGGYANSVGGSDHIAIVNNTLFKNDSKNTTSGEFQIQWHATNNIFKNNIVYATPQNIFLNGYANSTSNPADIDYNVYFSTAGASSSQWVWNGTTYTGYSSYQSSTGKDPHSPFADPKFLNLTQPDLRVAASSPAVNSGINLGLTIVGPLDYAGNARVQGPNIDIGAYEQ